MKKLVFIDIDGTIRNSNREISKRSINIIKKLKDNDIEVILTSGQNVNVVKRISELCNASEYIIASNGAHIINYKNNEIISTSSIDINSCEKIYEICQLNNVGYILHVGDNLLVNDYNFYNDIYNPKIKLIKSNISSYIKDSDDIITQCVVVDKTIDKIINIKKEISNIDNIKIINQSKCLINDIYPLIHHFFIDIVNINTSKGNGALKLANYLNIPLSNTIAIGDGINDIELFNVVGYKVAMGNAINELKDIADYITLSNDEDGVAIFLEKLYSEV